VFSQPKDTVIVKKFTQKDGLSSYNVRKIIQDEWGFIWVATQDGISRFDGQLFITYSKNALPGKKITGSDVKEIIEDTTQHVIWALFSEGGIDVINTITAKVERTISIPTLGQEDYNLSMLKYKDELWVGTSTGVRVYNCVQNTFVQDLPLPDHRNKAIDFAARSIQTDEHKNVWICYSGYGIVIYQGSTKAILQTIKLAELNNQGQTNEIRVPKAIFLKKGEVLLATSQGLRTIHYNAHYQQITVNKAPCVALPVLNRENIDWILRESENSLLVSGYNGFYRLNPPLTHFQEINEIARTYESNWLSSVLCLYKDKAGNTWLGCQEGLGFISNSRSPFRFYSSDPTSTVKLDHVFTVSPIAGDVILVGTRNGLVAIHQSEGRYVQHDKGHLFQHIFTDARGFIHVSRPDGLFIYRSERIIPIHRVYPEFRAYSTYSINSHLLSTTR
jgi:ligand-binding sensor domain-containing protein